MKGKFALTEAEYKGYQYRQEKPRGAFSGIWEPDNNRGSYKGAVDSQAIGRVEAAKRQPKRKKDSLEGLFLG